MAISRCDKHPPTGRTRPYVNWYEPVGYAVKAGVICGIKGCPNPGLIWCDANEQAAYDAGKRIFEAPTSATKFMVKDD